MSADGQRTKCRIVGRFTYDIQTYCAFFDKSTNFGTEVDQYIVSTFGGGAIAELPPGGRGGHFSKCRRMAKVPNAVEILWKITTA